MFIGARSKRRYQAGFVARVNDAEAKAAGTQVHLEIAFRHGYVDEDTFREVDDACEKVIGQLVKMIDQESSWIIRPGKSQPRV